MENQKFYIKQNSEKEYTTKKGRPITIPPVSKWSVMCGTKVVCNIPDYYGERAEGIAEGIAESLNLQKKFILPL